MSKFKNHKDPIDVLFSHMSHSNAEYRERLLIEWCKNHLKEYSVQRFTDINNAENKKFAEYSENAALMALIEGAIKDAAKVSEIKSEYGARYTTTIRLIL